MDALRFPIKFDGNGNFVKVANGTDEYVKQLISVCILTEPYILPLTPEFGVNDPSFSTGSLKQPMLAASKFIPEIWVLSLSSALADDRGKLNVKFVYNG